MIHLPLHRVDKKPERDKYEELRAEFDRKHHELRVEFERKHVEFERKYHDFERKHAEFERKHANFEQAHVTELAHTRDVLQYNTMKLLQVMGTEL